MRGEILALLGSYLLGAIPVGVIAARAFAGIDPRKVGSRNIGFTNVLRVAGKAAGITTLLGDMGKGAAAILLTRMLLRPEAGDWELVAGAAVILGHLYPVFLKFKGGKGVATALGVFLALDPLLGGILMLIWLASAAIWRTASLAAMIAITCLPILAWLLHPRAAMLIFAIGVCLVIMYRHEGNIRRLLSGTEPKLGAHRNVG
jgi:glycerol-3-phosphate acyltransferase PlsY